MDMEGERRWNRKRERNTSKAGKNRKKSRIEGTGLLQPAGLAGQFQRLGLLCELGQPHVEKRPFEHMPRVGHLLRVGPRKGIIEATKRFPDGLAAKSVKFFDIIYAEAVDVAQMLLDPLLHAFLHKLLVFGKFRVAVRKG